MQETTSKCADRINEELKGREAQIADLMTRGRGGDEEALDEVYNLALGVEHIEEITVTLSYGGPADYLHIIHSDGEVRRLTYRFSDWFDTAIVELDETSPLWDYASDIVEYSTSH